MKQFKKFYVLLLVSLLVVVTACKKDDDNDDNNQNPTPTPTLQTTISGVVTDENNFPLQGVTVRVENSNAPSVITNHTGSYYFHQVNTPQRVSLTFSKDNYLNVTRSETRTSSGVVTINGTMISKFSPISATTTIDATQGGEIVLTLNNTKISFPKDAFVDKTGKAYNGMVNIALAHLDPTADNFDMLIPGGDMTAKNIEGKSGIIIPYGIIKVELTDMSGNKIQLAGGDKVAEISVFVPDEIRSHAPATIPLWHFDEEKGIWIEEGSADLIGSYYEGTVSHFTDWNCDVWSENQATITGSVTDANGNPMAGVNVKTGFTSTVTDEKGVYTRVVPSGVSIDVRVLNYFGFSDSKPAGILSPGETKTINFNVPNPSFIVGKLLNCSGSPVAGTVGVVWGSSLEFYSMTYTSDGNFSIPMYFDYSSSYIYGYANNAYFGKDFWPMFNDEDKYEIDLLLCDIAVGNNQITLNGGEFNNQTYSNFNTENFASIIVFDEGDMTFYDTQIHSSGSDGSINISLVDCTTVGTFESYMHITLEQVGTLYMQNATTVITKFGSIGQLVEGTFTGIANYNDEAITISGNFSVIRHPDEHHGW